jgi:hypothetical protein
MAALKSLVAHSASTPGFLITTLALALIALVMIRLGDLKWALAGEVMVMDWLEIRSAQPAAVKRMCFLGDLTVMALVVLVTDIAFWAAAVKVLD